MFAFLLPAKIFVNVEKGVFSFFSVMQKTIASKTVLAVGLAHIP